MPLSARLSVKQNKGTLEQYPNSQRIARILLNTLIIIASCLYPRKLWELDPSEISQASVLRKIDSLIAPRYPSNLESTIPNIALCRDNFPFSPTPYGFPLKHNLKPSGAGSFKCINNDGTASPCYVERTPGWSLTTVRDMN